MKKANPRVGFFYCFMAERSRAPAGSAWGIRKLSPCRAQRARGTWANRLTAVAQGAAAPRAEGARRTSDSQASTQSNRPNYRPTLLNTVSSDSASLRATSLLASLHDSTSAPRILAATLAI